MKAREIYTDIPGIIRMPPDVNGYSRKPTGPIRTVLEGHGNEIFCGHARMCPRTKGMCFTDDKDISSTIKFVVFHAFWEVMERLTDKCIYKTTWLGFCSFTVCISMWMDQFNNFTTDTGDI